MNYQALTFWWMVGLTLLNAAIGVYLYWQRNNDVATRRISKMEGDVDARMDTHSERLTQIETQVKHMPQTPDLEKLYERIRIVDHTTTKMEGEFQEVRRTLGLIHSYLMTKDKP